MHSRTGSDLLKSISSEASPRSENGVDACRILSVRKPRRLPSGHIRGPGKNKHINPGAKCAYLKKSSLLTLKGSLVTQFDQGTSLVPLASSCSFGFPLERITGSTSLNGGLLLFESLRLVVPPPRGLKRNTRSGSRRLDTRTGWFLAMGTQRYCSSAEHESMWCQRELDPKDSLWFSLRLSGFLF